MSPQRIVCKLSVNVIIHLEVKLNYKKILENGWISKSKKGSCNIFDSKIKRIRYRFSGKNLYVIYRLLKQYLSHHYRFFDHFLYLKYHLRRLFFTEKRIVFTATRAIKTMRSASLMEQYSVLISNVLKCTQMANFALGSSN